MKQNGILILMAFSLGIFSCKKKGCIDPIATNYSEEAKKDDGSCIYPSIVTPTEETPTILTCSEFNQAGTTYELQDLGLEIDYIVECKMSISCDLQIKPGVVIAFATDAGLTVASAGSISAIATTENPFLFTGVDNAAGAWAGIFINSDYVKNKIKGCKIEYAGGDYFNSNGDQGAIILYAGSKAEISNNILENSETYGINASYTGGTYIFNNNTITNCLKPIFISAEYTGSITGGQYSGNTIDVVYINTYYGSITTPQTWNNLNVPYRIKGGNKLSSQTDWVIAPGTILEFEQGSGIKIVNSYSLKAVGTPSEHIIFRGVISAQGAWKNIKFWGTNVLNEIGYAEINNGGEDPTNTKGSVYLWYGAKLNIHDVHFKNNLGCGVYGVVSGGQTSNPNYSSSGLTFTNTPCTEFFE